MDIDDYYYTRPKTSSKQKQITSPVRYNKLLSNTNTSSSSSSSSSPLFIASITTKKDTTSNNSGFQPQKRAPPPVQKPTNLVDVLDLADKISSGRNQTALSLTRKPPPLPQQYPYNKRTAISPIGSPQYLKHANKNSPNASPVLSNQSLPSSSSPPYSTNNYIPALSNTNYNNNNNSSNLTRQLDYRRPVNDPLPSEPQGPRGRPKLPMSRKMMGSPPLQAEGIKRQVSNSRDPRLNNQKRQRPQQQQQQQQQDQEKVVYHSWEGNLYFQEKLVSRIKLEPGNVLHPNAIRKFFGVLKATSKPDQIHLSALLPWKRFEDIIKNRSPGLASVSIPGPSNVVELSKLRSFMQVNESVGIVYNPEFNQEALVIVPGVPEITSMVDPGLTDTRQLQHLYATYLVDLPKRPDFTHITYDPAELNLITQDVYFTWTRACSFLKFPQKLIDLMKNSKILVYGQTEMTAMLANAAEAMERKKRQTSTYIMMFDRYNKTIFSRPLTKHKKEYATKIWEFGVADLANEEMVPAAEVFPKNSGGFVMTDANNIIANPGIIEVIAAQIKKFNSNPIVYGQWEFILPSHIFTDMKNAIDDPADINRAKTAMVQLTLALSNNDVTILKLWHHDSGSEKNQTISQCIHTVAESYYKSRQFFVCIDDIGSVPQETKEQQFSTDFIQSRELFDTFTK